MPTKTSRGSFLKSRLLSGCRGVMGFVLVSMVLLIVTDITLRRVFNSPLAFSYEFIENTLIIIVICCVIASTTAARHISISLLTSRFPRKAQAIIDAVTDFPGVVLFGIIGWRCIVMGIDSWQHEVVTAILRVPIYPFFFIIVLGTILAALALLVRLVNSVIGEVRK